MFNGRIAVPSIGEGGLNSTRSEHFGHCDVFTLIDFENGKIKADSILANGGHEHGGCMVPVNLLAQQGVKAIIVAGIGRRPLIGFDEVGIEVYMDKVHSKVNEVLDQLMNDKLDKISVDETCGGGGNCH